MDFDTVLSLIDKGKTDEAKQAIESFKPQFEKTVEDLKGYESKFNEAKDGRDKVKGRLKEISDVLGVSVDDLSAERVKELLGKSKGDDVSKAEIENLTKLLQQKETEFTEKLNQSETRFRDKLIENEIAKAGLSADIVNDKALTLVIDALKSGATIEEGHIVYRENGVTLRNASGQPLTISEKMEQFKSDASNAFLFKATTTSGGGATQNNGGGAKVMDRASFEKSSPAEQMAFIKSGGTIK